MTLFNTLKFVFTGIILMQSLLGGLILKNQSFSPLIYINGKVQIPLKLEDVLDENIYENVWLDSDDKETDIIHLIEQNRISR